MTFYFSGVKLIAHNQMKAYFAEGIGTFAPIIIGMGAMIEKIGQDPVWVALAYALIILALISAQTASAGGSSSQTTIPLSWMPEGKFLPKEVRSGIGLPSGMILALIAVFLLFGYGMAVTVAPTLVRYSAQTQGSSLSPWLALT